MLVEKSQDPSRPRSSAFPKLFYVHVPASIPPPFLIPPGRQVVFACRSGRSIGQSLDDGAGTAGFPYGSHLAGGMLAWKAAGLPTET